MDDPVARMSIKRKLEEDVARLSKKRKLEEETTTCLQGSVEWSVEEKVVRALKEAKPKLEKKYRVRISKSAFDIAVSGVRTFVPNQIREEKCVGILDAACKLVLERFKNCDFEKQFYERAYILRRALVELLGLCRMGQYDPSNRTWVNRLRRERDCMSIDIRENLLFWSRVLLDCGAFGSLTQEESVNTKPLAFAKQFQKYVYWKLVKTSSNGSPNGEDFALLLDEIQGKLSKIYCPFMTVHDSHVAEVISSLTDVPLTHIIPPIDLKMAYLTNKRVVDQEQLVNEMFETLVSEAQRQNTACRGLFLLLGAPGVGKSEIAKAVAEHWYCDASRLVEIDISDYEEPQMESSQTRSKGKCEDLLNRLSEIVAKRPYSVILLDKIDKAPSHVTMVIGEVLRNHVDFSKSIIFMTSCVGSNQLELESSTSNDSGRERVLNEARKFFSAALLEPLDNVFVVEKFNDRKSVARLLLREIVSEAFGQRFVVHASDDALGVLFEKASEQYNADDGKGIKESLVEHVIPKLSAAESHDNVVVCVDTLVGTKELSFRFQTQELPVDDWYFKLRRGSFSKMIANIRKKTQAAFKVFDLGNVCLPLLDDCPAQICCVVDKLLGACKELIFCPPCPNLLDNYNENNVKMHANMGRSSRNVEPTVEEKEMIMGSWRGLGENDDGSATRVFVEALVNVVDAPPERPARYYLCLGLEGDAKAGLINILTESLKTGSGKKLFTHLKLDSNCRGEEVTKFLIKETKERPCWLLMLDGVEFADSVLYNTLLEIFDKGFLEDDEGFGVDFRNTVVILTSKAANKCQVTNWFGYEPDALRYMITACQTGKKRFRTELLHRLDEIIVFDPLSPDIRRIRKGHDSDYTFSPQMLFTLFMENASSIQHSKMLLG